MAITITHAAGKAVIVKNEANAYDFTEKVLKGNPELAAFGPISSFVDVIGKTPEGKFKIILNLKDDMENVTPGAQLSAEAKDFVKSVFEIDFEGSWTKKKQINKIIDMKATETSDAVAACQTSLINDNIENLEKEAYDTLFANIILVNSIKSADGTDVATTVTSQVAPLSAGGLVDDMMDISIKALKTGRKSSSQFPKHPLFRGLKPNNFGWIVATSELKTLSKDPRYIAISTGTSGTNEIPTLNGVVGHIMNIPVTLDVELDERTINSKAVKAVLIPLGKWSPLKMGIREEMHSLISPDNRFPIAFDQLNVSTNRQIKPMKHYFHATFAITAA